MEIRLLGPVEVRDDGVSLALPRRQHRALLAALALRAGATVSTDRLVADLWGERAPASARGSLQNAVSALRMVLGEGVVDTRPPGYALVVDADDVDVNRFERLVGEAVGAEPARRAALLSEAVALWRGPALADLDELEFARLEAARLDGRYVDAIEERLEAELELGRHSTLVGELEGMVAAHPLRERLRGQLMLALYRSGRQAEALEVYRAARLALADELGLEPSRELQELERNMLRQEPSLSRAAEPRVPGHGWSTAGGVTVVTAPGRPTIVGRADELAAVDDLLAAAARGRSATLVIRGEPGIGKSTLLSYAAARAAGATVLRTRGIEAESEIGYAGLAAVLEPLVEAVGNLPGPQAGALVGALGLGPSVPADPFAVAVATLSLLSAAAEASPIVVLVDDAQWLDGPSQQALIFAARRLEADGVALLVALRDDEPSPFDSTELPALVVGRLGAAEAETLLERGAPTLSPRRRHAVLETADGNPLALIELPLLLDEREESAIPTPLPPGRAVENAYRHRLALHAPEERQVLLLAAADDTADPQVLLEAMRLLGLDEAAAEAAEAHGAITLGAEIQFRHPLMRSVVYGDASPPQRRRAHAALADVLGANGSRVRAAWHRALAATRADATLADELAEAADELRARGAYSAAAGFGEHAARLTPARELRARRLTSTASDAQVAGLGGHAEALLDQALELTADPLVRSDAQGLRARGLLFTGRPLDALALLLDEADRIEPLDRARAALLLAQAIPVCSMAGVIDRGLEVGQRAVELAADADDGLRTIAELARSQTLQLAGDAEGARRLRENVRRRPHLDDPRALLELNQVEAGHLMVVGDHGAAKASIDHLIALARAAAAPALMPFALATRSEINLRTGHWVEAIADATEAVELARQTGQPAHAAYAAMIHARLLSARGLAAESAAALDEAEHIGRVGGIGALRFYVPAARAFDALGRGDLEGAVGFGLEVDWISRERGLGEPGVVLWPPDLVEALAWLERRDEAGRVLERFETQAEATGRVWALATAARCRGLLAGEGHYETRFAEAIEHHERLDMPFERARTDLCLGERRAAFGRAREAVAPLRRALAVFERLGAHPWTARTAVALASVGARVDRAEPPVVDLLTEHELRVALALASGASTSDTATQLFLGPRTVEAHARAVYEKLSVSTPDEVGRRLRPSSAWAD